MLEKFVLGKNIILSNFKINNSPYKLLFSVTNNCNSRCKTCNNWKTYIKKELSLDEIESFFKKNNKFSWITLSGGEPFLRKDLVSIVKIIKQNCKNLYLFTIATSSLLTKKTINDIKKIIELNINLFFVTISLDGDEKNHDYIRGIEGSYSKAIYLYKELKKLENSNFKVVFGNTLSKFNFGNVQNMFNEVKKDVPKLKIEDFHFNIYHESKQNYGNMSLIKDKDKYNKNIIEGINSIIKLKKWKLNAISYLEKKYLILAKKYLRTNKCPVECKVGYTSCFMNSSGDIYPCSNYYINMGNIKNFDFDLSKIWNSKKYDMVRQEIKMRKCPQCWTPCEAYQSII